MLLQGYVIVDISRQLCCYKM